VVDLDAKVTLMVELVEAPDPYVSAVRTFLRKVDA
jgi:hypothetical protein